MQYIRNYYKVPAKRFGRIEWLDATYKFLYGFLANRDGKRLGVIVGARGQYLRVRFDIDPKRIVTIHPTDNVTYLPKP